mgnify:CR=1 FL=1
MRPLRPFLLLALLCAGRGAPAANPGVRRFPGGEVSRFANAYWFRTERGSVLVDAPLLRREAEALRSEIASAGGLPLGAAILTSGRPEAAFGLGALLSPSTRVWGSRATAALLESTFARERERLLRAGVPLAALPLSPPRITSPFTRSLSLGFEGYTLRLLSQADDGTEASTVVFVPETGELFTGHLVWNRVHPMTAGADLGAWRRALNRLRQLSPRVVYPGHGEPGARELLDEMAAYLGALEEAVRPLAFRSRLSAGDVRAAGRALGRARRSWLLPDVVDGNVRAEHARLRALLAGED